jgi:hypothetical protein
MKNNILEEITSCLAYSLMKMGALSSSNTVVYLRLVTQHHFHAQVRARARARARVCVCVFVYKGL